MTTWIEERAALMVVVKMTPRRGGSDQKLT
jgi:hypothetical protein